MDTMRDTLYGESVVANPNAHNSLMVPNNGGLNVSSADQSVNIIDFMTTRDKEYSR